MVDDKFLLVSLDEHKSKELAQVLSNDTARKLLDYMGENDNQTESDMAKALKIPLSTVHYNLQQLKRSRLVDDDYYSYSEKGKKISHYTLSNKYVIIAPKGGDMIREHLKKFIPIAVLSGIIALGIRFSSKTQEYAMPQLRGADMMLAAESSVQGASSGNEIALWFLFGSAFALLAYYVWAELILKKR